MGLLERVKERTNAELSDGELQELIDEATAEIVRRYGETGQAVTERHEGGSASIITRAPIDETIEASDEVAVVTIVETSSGDELELEADDFEIWPGGQRVKRASTGTNPRSKWGEVVNITYTPVSDQKQRDEVTIKLVKLSIEYEGVKSEGADGYKTDQLDYQTERENLLASLDRSIRMA